VGSYNLITTTLNLIFYSYRTLSVHQTIQPGNQAIPPNIAAAADAIRGLDIHVLSVNDVFLRLSTSPTQGLEGAAIERLSALGRNLIPPPPTQYYKKILNYIFGGFNFLMWIAFIVTIVRVFHFLVLRKNYLGLTVPRVALLPAPRGAQSLHFQSRRRHALGTSSI